MVRARPANTRQRAGTAGVADDRIGREADNIPATLARAVRACEGGTSDHDIVPPSSGASEISAIIAGSIGEARIRSQAFCSALEAAAHPTNHGIYVCQDQGRCAVEQADDEPSQAAS
jgi:hypothetical protein